MAEGRAFLKWLADRPLHFIGYREYDLVHEDGQDALHIVEGRGLGILRERVRRRVAVAYVPPAPDRGAPACTRSELLLLTKANSRSTVHRPVFLDYVGIRRFDADGEVVGEYRFLGLYASSAYHESPRAIPSSGSGTAT